MQKKIMRRFFKPQYLLWLANLSLILPWFAIAGLALLGRLNHQPDPMPVLLVLALVVGVITIILSIVAVVLGFGMGIVAIIWASRVQSLERMSWAIATWIFLLISWVWFGLAH
jgi:hypothetical protein